MRTSSGFEFEVAEDALNDMELLDAIAELEENPLKLTKVIRLLLGDKAKKRLYDHVRNESGKVPPEAVSNEVAEIFNLLQSKLKK